MAGATRPERRALENWLLVVWEKEVAMVTQQELSLCFFFFFFFKLPSFPLSLQDQDTALENFLTVASPLYQKPRLSTVSYLEKLLCGIRMPANVQQARSIYA